MGFTFGGEPQHVVTDESGNVQDDVDLEVWTDRNGTRITAIYDLDGNPLPGVVTSDIQGRYPFMLDSDTYGAVWLRDPAGSWWQVIADDLLEQVPDAVANSQAALDQVTDLESEVDASLAKIPSMRVAVEAYGAVGTADDTATFQAAINAVSAFGGGVVELPVGEYKIAGTQPVRIYSNTEIAGHGTSLTKASSSFYAMFVILSDTEQGYGSGAQDVYIHGIHFRGRFGDTPMQICPFAFHHAERVLVEACTFETLQRTGHTFDMGGCRDIIIRGCTWLGFDPGSTDATAEAIQIDISSSGAVSYQDQPASYDGLMTTRVWVDRCRFLPADYAGVTYPCPVPIGGHNSVENHYIEDIWFTNNLILDPAAQTGNELQHGIIHLPNSRRVQILNNVFRQTQARSARVINCTGTADGTLDGADWSASGKPSGAFTPQYCEDIKIIGNTFDGFGDNTTAYPVIYIEGPTTDQPCQDVDVRGNSFINCNNGLSGDGAGTSFKNCASVRAGGNRFANSHGGYRLNWVTSASVGDGDVADNLTYRYVHAPVVNNLTITSAAADSAGPIYIGSSSTTNLCTGIAITGNILADTPVTLASSVRAFAVVGNVLRGSSGAAVSIGGSTNKGRVGMNAVVGYPTAVSGAGGSDVLIDDVAWAA